MNTDQIENLPIRVTAVPAWQELQRANEENPNIWQESPLPRGNLHRVLRPLKGKRGMPTLRPLPTKSSKVTPVSEIDESVTICTAEEWDPHVFASTSKLESSQRCSDTSSEKMSDRAPYSPPTPEIGELSRPLAPSSGLRDGKGRRPSYDVIATKERKLEVVERVESFKGNPASLNPRSPLRAESGGAGGGVVLSRTEADFLADRRASLASLDSEAEESTTMWTRATSDGEHSKARWAKAHWYAMQKAGGAKQEQSARQVVDDNRGEQFAKVVNMMVFARHWRDKALGQAGSEECEAGAKSPGGAVPRQRRWDPWLAAAAVALQVLHGLASLYVIVAWDLNVLLDDSGMADTALRAVSAGAMVVMGADLVWRVGRRRVRLLSCEGLLDFASCLSLLPEAAYLVGGVDLLGEGGQGRWAVAVRAVRAGLRISVSAGMVAYLLHQQRRRHQLQQVPESVRAEVEQERGGRPVRAVVNAMVEGQTASLVLLLLALHLGLHMLLDRQGLRPEQGTASMLAVLCRQEALAQAGTGPAVEPATMDAVGVGEWELPALSLRLCGRSLDVGPHLSRNLRPFPSAVVSYVAAAGACECALEVDGSRVARTNAAANLAMVAAVVVVMVGGTRWMRVLLEREVVEPLEEMQRKVLQMLSKPMRIYTPPQSARVQESFVVERAMGRFTSLLRLSLGEAGGKVVTANLTDGISIDRSLPGKIVNGIFGFCDIRNFTDLTEVLQADVMTLVNTIALYVHEAVTANYGAPNKNIGDAFLLVWKPNRGRQVQEVADAALRALVEIIKALHRSTELRKIATRSDVQQRLPGYAVHMGFGLHYGWAVEGAIGSSRKIDASYLSPHVNLAARLESATKQYGVPILLSESMCALLSPAIQALLRLLDRVVVKGTSTPMRLYTFDVWHSDSSEPTRCSSEDSLSLVEEVAGLSARRLSVKASEALAPSSDAEYRRDFAEAVEWYLGGETGQGADWTKASALLKDCWMRCPHDGAAKALLDYITEAAGPGGCHPAGWGGYRVLHEK